MWMPFLPGQHLDVRLTAPDGYRAQRSYSIASATIPGYHVGRIPPNKGRRYPADPPRVEQIVAVMRAAGESRRATECAA